MVKLQIFLLIGLFSYFQFVSSSIICYSCKQSSNSNCGPIMTNTAGVGVCTDPSACITFTNIYDNNGNFFFEQLIYFNIFYFIAIWRDCASNIWLPSTLINQTNTCGLDPFSQQLFCICNTGTTCNENNTGSMIIYSILKIFLFDTNR
jgi:hypothetical protein